MTINQLPHCATWGWVGGGVDLGITAGMILSPSSTRLGKDLLRKIVGKLKKKSTCELECRFICNKNPLVSQSVGLFVIVARIRTPISFISLSCVTLCVDRTLTSNYLLTGVV